MCVGVSTCMYIYVYVCLCIYEKENFILFTNLVLLFYIWLLM